MQLDLNKEMLLDLLYGTAPSYDLFGDDYENIPIENHANGLGSYWDNGGWSWNKHIVEKLNEKQIYGLYKLCKASWSK